jgi:lipopolysaccharide transport system ATP-binding protein
MSRTVITVEGLGKRYRIGTQEPYHTLRDAIVRNVSGLGRLIGGGSNVRAPDEQDLWALRDVSFELKSGGALGIIGGNGAGKSTLLKILSRITTPTSGRAEIHGRIGSLLEVGTGFHPELTGRDNVFLNGAVLGLTRREIASRFDEIVAFAEVERFVDTPLKHYSSGMQVRLAFAVAAHLEADILLLDEVLSVGDTAFQRKCLGQMERITREERTIIFVSHNLQAVRQFCPHALWLSGGLVAAEGLAGDVIEKYLHAFQQTGGLAETNDFISKFPADPVFRMDRVGVRQGGERTLDVVGGKPIDIEVAYELTDETSGFHIFFQLWDPEGNLLFESVDNGDRLTLPVTSAGRYVSRATIPADFLSPIQYELRIGAGIHEVRNCIPEMVRMPLTVVAVGMVNRAYPGYVSSGKLAPLIDWSIERVGSATKDLRNS